MASGELVHVCETLYHSLAMVRCQRFYPQITFLLIRHAHQFSHPGLDGTLSISYAKGYWTIRAGHVARAVKNQCKTCRKIMKVTIEQPLEDFTYDYVLYVVQLWLRMGARVLFIWILSRTIQHMLFLWIYVALGLSMVGLALFALTLVVRSCNLKIGDIVASNGWCFAFTW